MGAMAQHRRAPTPSAGGGDGAHPPALHEETPYRWRIERAGAMRVPGIVFACRSLLPALVGDESLSQVANVATLPGIVDASYAMPDVHWGYGFPIGGVAATDVGRSGVVSPGGVGFDNLLWRACPHLPARGGRAPSTCIPSDRSRPGVRCRA